MFHIFKTATVLAVICAASLASAADFTVHIENLTNSIWYTPFLVAAHPEDSRLFVTGEAASADLQAMAEGGELSGLVAVVQNLGATFVENPAGGLLPPGMSTEAALNTNGTENVRLTVVAMLLPTNDAFAGLNAITIPTEPGVYIYNLPAYDAGTEANDEILNAGAGGAPGAPGIPADPSGLAGTGATGAAGADTNNTVHIHRNTLGDTDAIGGMSDLDSRIHRWLNPVARVTVTVR